MKKFYPSDKALKRICVLTLVLLWAWSVVGQTPAQADTPTNSDNIIISPNPLSNYLQINTLCDFRILNIAGQIVYTGTVENTKSSFDVSNLKEGIHFVEIYKEEQLIVTKIVRVLD